MKIQWLDDQFMYDGSQLQPLFAYLNWGLLGDSVVAWLGPCRVETEHMVDGEDLRAQSAIAGDQMLHFIVEKFNCSLLGAVALQRLLAAMALEQIRLKPSAVMSELIRQGDDLYWREGKLSISIASISSTSAMIHFAINVTNKGTPVKTAALADLGIEPKAFAQELMERFSAEVISIEEATRKVFPLNLKR